MENGSAPQSYQRILDDSPLPWAVYNREGTLIAYNQLVQDLFGVEMKPLVGQYNILNDPEARRDGFYTAFEQALKGNAHRLPAQRYAGQSGDVWYEAVLFPNRSDSGELVSVSVMFQNVTAQKRIEEELLRRTEEIIQAQQATLRELSTPLIPLADHVVVMPLVGSIDSARAQMIMETLLEGISTHQADVAILDITGVPVVDTQVADALLRTARAARLLGAQVVLTGIGGHIAQTLITLGADLSGLVTLNNLQSGITYALRVAAGVDETGSKK
ncbi:MAG TPA: STAS domain-containing protein [Roseiflexaceae bacterium]|nr:STAS domain-containing protein [Roseiflexaceae bacterium]